MKKVPWKNQKLTAIEREIARGEFANVRSFYDGVPKGGGLYFAVVRQAVIAAVMTGDRVFFNRVAEEFRVVTAGTLTEEDALAAEMIRAWILQFLCVGKGYPEWLKQMNLMHVPEHLRLQAGYLVVKFLFLHGKFAEAYGASTMMLSFCRFEEGLFPIRISLMLICAAACRDMGRMDEACEWFSRAAQKALPLGVILPFCKMTLGPTTHAVKAIAAVLGEPGVDVIRQRSADYFGNLIRFHNHYTGEGITEALNPREFYLARMLLRGVTYKEAAVRMELSPGRINVMVSTIYEKLNIHARKELKGLVF